MRAGLTLVAALGSLLLLALPGEAWAGACCVGSPSPLPMRAGECEQWVLALGVTASHGVGRWDGQGVLAPSSLRQDTLRASVGAAWRWNRTAQINVALPTYLNHRGVGEEVGWGGGPGDLRITGVWDPVLERPGGPPIPVWTLGARLPTGKTWRQSDHPLGVDVTGLPPAVLLGASLERTVDRTPWSLGMNLEAGFGKDARSAVTASAAVGRYLGFRTTLLGSLSHTRTLGAPGARTRAGVRIVEGRPVSWRAWVGLDADLPVPYLGQDNVQEVSLSVGYAWVR